jgi:hypothetical protein
MKTYEEIAAEFVAAVADFESLLEEMYEHSEVRLHMEFIPCSDTGKPSYFNYQLYQLTHQQIRTTVKMEWRVVEKDTDK